LTHRITTLTRQIVVSVAVVLLLTAAAAAAGVYPNGHLLAEPSWLAENLNQPNLVIIDARSKSAYDTAHIPGAVRIPGSGSINDPNAPVDGWLLGPEDFQDLMRQIGVNADSTVVIYHNESDASATRIFYALELYGHFDKVKVLNGGWAAWVAERRPITNVVPQPAPGNFTATLVPERIATADYIAEKIGEVTIIDARSEGEHTGETIREGVARGGHIPTAIHLEWTNNLEDGRFKSADELFAMYSGIGADPDDEIIAYCQTNVRSSHTYFTLRLLGYENVRPYEGSWAEWGNLENVPIEAGHSSIGL